MSSQSLTTPATFIVSALVLPISKKTLIFNPKAMAALERKIGAAARFACTAQGMLKHQLVAGFQRIREETVDEKLPQA